MKKPKAYLHQLSVVFLLLFVTACASKPEEKISLEKNKTPAEWLELAQSSYKNEEFAKAQNAYLHVLAEEPENLKAIEGLAHTQTDLHNYDDSLKTWNILLDKNSKSTEAGIAKAKLLIRFGQLPEAEDLLQSLSGQAADDWRVWDSRGVIHDLQNDYTNAKLFYSKALEKNPTQPELYNNLGYSQIMTKSYKEAIQTFNTGLKYAPNSEHLQSNLAIAYAWLGEYKEAKLIFIPIVGEAEAYNNVGYIAMLNNDFTTAENYFQTAIDKSPSFYRTAYANLDKLREKQGIKDESSR